MSKMIKIAIYACLFISFIILGGCSKVWSGFVYPHRDNLPEYISIGEFKSLEACRIAANAKLRSIGVLDSGEYECGLNCKRNEYGNYICKETSE